MVNFKLHVVVLLFSRQVVSDSLQLHGLQHASLPCPPLSPGICSNSRPLNWWYHPTISSSVIPLSSCLQSFPASGSLMSQLLASGGQSIGDSALPHVKCILLQGKFENFQIKKIIVFARQDWLQVSRRRLHIITRNSAGKQQRPWLEWGLPWGRRGTALNTGFPVFWIPLGLTLTF